MSEVKDINKKNKNNELNELKPSDFVHLHNHTQYSLLDGLTKIDKMVAQVKNMGMEAIAMTDHGTMSGAVDFYMKAKDGGIKSIIGIEAYMAPRAYSDKDPSKDKQYYHLIILAMNNQGYQNLMRLSTISHLEGFYYKPRIDREVLKKYNEGLIVLSGCINGEFGDAIRQGQIEQAEETAKWYKEVFGDRYYIEIQDHGHREHTSAWDEQIRVTDESFKIAEKLDIPTVITGDAHYLVKEDQEAHEILLCVQTGAFLSDENRMSLKEFELYVADPKDIIKRWGKSHPESVLNTKKIAERCDVNIKLGEYLIPKFPVPKGEDEKSYLKNLTYKGLANRYLSGSKPKEKLEDIKKQLKKEIVERAEYELQIIDRMGFDGYFLIVQDFINWGKDKGIVFGPGRGSGAGSIVAYGLKITELDPLEYDLMFERFLNPDRISMPDFDVDIQDTRRDEVIQYCVEKYGEDRVANIVTFGTMAARNAVRDVARVLQVPYAEADRLAKMIPPPVQGRHIPLSQSLKDNADLKREYKDSENAKRVFDLAMNLEGTIRSHGVHAAGVVIAPDDIVKFTSLEKAQKGVIATQYSMVPVEKIGLLKMDFLGLSNLTIINNALRIIKRVYGKDIDLNTLPLDDQKTYELFRRGDTTGVFQFESAGMKRYLKQLKPTEFMDLVAMNALYRPGPMEQIPAFIKGKNDAKSVTYMHDSLKPVLKDTYGVIVYQENIIQLLQLIAGYTPGEADLVRKAIGKKNRSIMEAEKPRFIKGCEEQGLNNKEAEKIWNLIQPFADYSFNKAHAACYALIAYQTAYLKANYPTAFMAALMTSDFDDSDRLAIEISECKSMGIEVLPPDINESFGEFAVIRAKGSKKESIRFGLNAIKNVGTGAVEEIINAREKVGGFSELETFLANTSTRAVNKKAIESLAKAGALDGFEERSVIVENLDNMLAFASRRQKDMLSGQTDLFGNELANNDLKIKLSLLPATSQITEREKIAWERELLGIYLSSHPLSAYEDTLKNSATPISQLGSVPDGKNLTVGGSMTDIREITTKNGRHMAFARIADMSGDVELVIFPGVMEKTGQIWARDNVLLVKGKLSKKDRNGVDGEPKIMVESATEIDLDAPDDLDTSRSSGSSEPRVYVRIESTEDQQALANLKNAIDKTPGLIPVVLVVGPDDDKQVIKIPTLVEPSEEFLDEAKQIFGEASIKYQ